MCILLSVGAGGRQLCSMTALHISVFLFGDFICGNTGQLLPCFVFGNHIIAEHAFQPATATTLLPSIHF